MHSTALHPSPPCTEPHSTAQIAPSIAASPPPPLHPNDSLPTPSLPELLAAWRDKRSSHQDSGSTKPHSTAQPDTQSTSAPSILADMRSEMRSVAQLYGRQGGNQGRKKGSDRVGGSGENRGDYSEFINERFVVCDAAKDLSILISSTRPFPHAPHPIQDSQATRSLASPLGVNLVAFSGGVDSSLAALLLPSPCIEHHQTRLFHPSLSSCSPPNPNSQETRSLASPSGVNLVAFSGGVDFFPLPTLSPFYFSHPFPRSLPSQETRSLASPSGVNLVNLVAFSGGVDSSLAALLLHRAFSDSLTCSLCHQPTSSQETRSLSSPSGVNLVAFSGGVDSSLAALLLHRALSDPPPLHSHSQSHSHSHSQPHSHSRSQSPSHTDSHSNSPPTVAAVIALSPSLSSSQLITARHVAAAIGIPLWEVETTEGQVQEYVANEGASCYACKATLYTTLYTVAQQSLTRMGMENSNMNEGKE
ncbi:unnamed protein product [Closterium sp. NIES-53]